MIRLFGIVGALYGLTGVALGAFAAHALSGRLDQEAMKLIDTGVRYQFVHALALLVTALVAQAGSPHASVRVSGWMFIIGVPLFSASLYLLALGAPRWLGAVTPLGGLSFLAGWAGLAFAAWKAAS